MFRKAYLVLVATVLLLATTVFAAALEPTPVSSSEPAIVAVQPVPDAQPAPQPAPCTLEFSPENVTSVVMCTVQSSENYGECLSKDIHAGICKCFGDCSICCRKLTVSEHKVTRATYVVTKPCCKPIRVHVVSRCGCDDLNKVVSKHL